MGTKSEVQSHSPPKRFSDAFCKTVKPDIKKRRYFDSNGLYLEVSPKGGKYWWLKYRIRGIEKRLSFGVYPEVGLQEARDRRDEARRLMRNGFDPGKLKKEKKYQASALGEKNSFEAVVREWFVKQSSKWISSHAKKIIRRFEREIFPWLGTRPVSEITPPELLNTLRRIEERGAIETAHRALQYCGQVFRYAIATGRANNDISAGLKGALPPMKKGHFAAITDPNAAAALLRVIKNYKGDIIVCCALKLAPLVFVRPGELRHAEWSEIDFDDQLWSIPAKRMKMREAHLVPLSLQAIEILKELQPITGNGHFIFPSPRSDKRPISDNAVLAALRRMGIGKDEMTGHGFRAMARTILDEVLGVRPDYIEHQLAHAVRDPNGRAYNRTTHLKERRIMMQDWADYLDSISGQ